MANYNGGKRRASGVQREGNDHGFAAENGRRKGARGRVRRRESKKEMHMGHRRCRSVNNFRKLNYTGFSPLLIFARDFSVA